jgi:hypothetical protein
MAMLKTRHRVVAVMLCGAIFAGGCTGNAGGDAAIVGVGSGLAAGLIGRGAGMKGKSAAVLGVGVGVAAGAVTYFVAKSKYEREADERDRAEARRRAREVAAREQTTRAKPREDDYYVATSRRVEQGKPVVEVQKIDHTTNEPVGPVMGIDQKDIEQAKNDGKPVSIDGHELAG